MNLLIFGATGGTGRALVEQALAQGHAVTAFARDPSKVRTTHANLKVAQGNVLDRATVEAALQGQDAVLSALGVRLRWQPIVIATILCQVVAKAATLSGALAWLVELGIPFVTILIVAQTKPILSQGTTHIVQAMQKLRGGRFICESSLGVGDSRGQLGLFYTYVLIPLLLRATFADKDRQERIIRASPLAWVIVRPTLLTNGPRTGNYRSWSGAKAPAIRGKISRADVADFMLKQVSGSEFLGQTVGLSY